MGRHSMSGYCHTCRARRVKCDRGRPYCQRCLRSGHSCRGYLPGSRLRMQNTGVSIAAGQGVRMVRLPSSGGSSAPGILVGIDLSGFREHMTSTYFFGTYTWAHFWKPLLQWGGDRNIVSIQHKSSLALIYSYFGREKHDRGTELRGLELYGTSIREVKAALDRGCEDELAVLAATVMILGMFTYAVDKSLDIQHHFGGSQILRYCGPHRFQKESLIDTFRSCRVSLICQSLARRSRTFLDGTEWKTTPFQLQRKEALDYLFDILADLPSILEDIDGLQQCDPLISRAQLTSRVSILSSWLRRWRLGWDVTNPGAASDLPPSAVSGASEEALKARMNAFLHQPLKFQNSTQAMDIFTYNATLLYLMQLDVLLRRGSLKQAPLSDDDLEYIMRADSERPKSALLTPSKVKFLCQPALEAYRILPYLKSQWVVETGKVMMILAPVGVMYCVLQKQSEVRDLITWSSLLPNFNHHMMQQLEVYQV